ncbi:MAG: sensor histidine kinase N-terminal domain-containing protein [Aquabacterium sp.]|nr:sensor histidine kinase N-terminal domain-containing protein [Aquabacterium sp.]
MKASSSIQSRLLLLVIGSVLTVWLVAAALTWGDARHELDELLDSHLTQAAALLVAQQGFEHEAGEHGDEHGLDAPVLHRYAPKVAFQVFHEGRLALRTANAPAEPMVDMAERWREGFRTVEIDGVRWRIFATHGAERDVQVYVGEQIDSRADILKAILRSVLWPIAFALPVLMLAVWLAIRHGLRPLRQIRDVLQARRADALEPVQLPTLPAELAPMLDALNALLGRMATLLSAERRFTADAAHELRTPIAAIRTQAQVALAETDEAARQHALQATLAGCDRATRLVEQLLALSRLEAGQPLPMGTVDLVPLTRQIMADLTPLALARGQHIELQGVAHCPVQGDAALLAVLVRNLIDNAARYSPEGARIVVTMGDGDQAPQLSVEDSGPGLSEADQARLGERFFRVLGSGQAGSGLGWSIVRRIAAVHQARIDTERSAQLGGLAVQVRWPAQP